MSETRGAVDTGYASETRGAVDTGCAAETRVAVDTGCTVETRGAVDTLGVVRLLVQLRQRTLTSLALLCGQLIVQS